MACGKINGQIGFLLRKASGGLCAKGPGMLKTNNFTGRCHVMLKNAVLSQPSWIVLGFIS